MATAKAPAPSSMATVDIERSLAAVRAEFFDVDHHIRDKVYRGLRMRWAPPKVPGERRVRQGMRVLDRVAVEEFVIEESSGKHPKGAWVKRFVEGANAGTEFVATFFAQGENTTVVQVQAFVGPNGFATGLGKLSPLGLDKALQKMLLEHKRAIEGYEPGRTRGAITEVLQGWSKLTAPIAALEEGKRRAVIGTVLEAASAIAVVDEVADPAERDAMNAAASALAYELSAEVEARMIRHATEAIESDGVEARCATLGARLKALGVSELGISVAVLVAEVSRGLDLCELAALRRLALAAGFDDFYLSNVIDRIDMALSGDRPSRVSVFI